MSKRLDLAHAQLVGYQAGQLSDLIPMIEDMGLKASEWDKLKSQYDLTLDEWNLETIDAFFESREPDHLSVPDSWVIGDV